MIAIVADNSAYEQLEQMNEYGRYSFYRAKARDGTALCEELGRLADCSHVILEYAVLTDAEVLIQTLVEKCKVIMLASELSPYDMVVRDFYGMGITDVITANGSEMQKQVNEILMRDNAQDASPAPAPAANKADPAPAERQQVLADRAAGADVARVGDKDLTIAFAGAGPRIGTTTQVFQTAFYLRSLYRKTAVVDLSGRDWIAESQEWNADYDIHVGNDGQYTVHNIPFFVGGRHIAQVKNEFDAIVYDYGNFADVADVVSVLEKDVAVIVCGFKATERLHILPAFECDPGTFKYLFSFVPQTRAADVMGAMRDVADRTMIADSTPDIWRYCGNDALYGRITGTVQPRTTQKKRRKHLFPARGVG